MRYKLTTAHRLSDSQIRAIKRVIIGDKAYNLSYKVIEDGNGFAIYIRDKTTGEVLDSGWVETPDIGEARVAAINMMGYYAKHFYNKDVKKSNK